MNKILSLLIIAIFLASCDYPVLNPGPNSNNSNSEHTKPDSDTKPSKPEESDERYNTNTMYLKFQISGKSSSRRFYQNDRGKEVYPHDVVFQVNTNYYKYKGKWGSPGWHQIYGFCNDRYGNSLNIPNYIGNEVLKISYIEKDSSAIFKSYFAVNDYGYNFFRENIEIKVPIDKFDSNKYTNVAKFKLDINPDYPSSYTFTFEGFDNLP